MAFSALWLQNLTYPARIDRAFADNIWTEGTLGAGSLEVTESTVPAMSVQVAAGSAVVLGTDQVFQGKYLVREQAATTGVTIAAAPGSGQRNDLIIVQVRDPNAGGAAGDDAIIAVVPGTPSVTPVDPTPPDSSLVLARVRVPAGTGSITNSLIDDLRSPATLAHPVVGPGDLQPASVDVAALASAVQALLVPSGSIMSTISATAPSGWLLLDGSTVLNGDVLWPGLWAVAPAAWRSGTSLILPDWRGRTVIGAGTGPGLTARTLNGTGGSEDLAAHTHSINHDHASFNTAVGGTHSHTSPYTNLDALPPPAPLTSIVLAETSGFTFNVDSTNSGHQHAIDVPAFTGTSGSTGAGAAGNMMPWAAANLIVKG